MPVACAISINSGEQLCSVMYLSINLITIRSFCLSYMSVSFLFYACPKRCPKLKFTFGTFFCRLTCVDLMSQMSQTELRCSLYIFFLAICFLHNLFALIYTYIYIFTKLKNIYFNLGHLGQTQIFLHLSGILAVPNCVPNASQIKPFGTNMKEMCRSFVKVLEKF